MQTLQKNISDRVRSEVEIVVATVGKKVHAVISSAIDALVVARMELAMRLVGFFLHLICKLN